MISEPWRAAIARWGDIIYGLALLTTGDEAAASTTTFTAFRTVLPRADAPDLEYALYRALIQPRRHWSMRLPHRSLPPALRSLAPNDRLLLGLWLLRDADGEQLATLFDQPPQGLIERLHGLLDRVAGPLDDDLGLEHASLDDWLAQQLGFAAQPTAHVRMCRRCQAAQQGWREAVERTREVVLDVARSQRLPQAIEDGVGAALATQESSAPWWQQQRIWLPALIGLVAILLALVIVPSGGEETPAAAPPSAYDVVRQTLDAWNTLPDEGVVHRQVWALQPWLSRDEAVITDVWLTGDAAHRVEVHRGGPLVEWQLADGSRRLDYGAVPTDTTCRWNTGWSGTFPLSERAALRFPASAAQQAAVRDARLQQGAYGQGYILLQQALDASDLRSFGVRVEDGRAVTVLSFTNTSVAPPRQVVLRIDADQRQLEQAQEISTVGGQSVARDLWRLQVNETLDDMPRDRPRSRWVQDRELFDPACVALRADQVLSLRTLAAMSNTWYVPATMPSGMTNAAIVYTNATLIAVAPPPLSSINASVLYVGPGRYLGLSAINERRNIRDGQVIARNGWRVSINESESGQLSGVLLLDPSLKDRFQSERGILFWAHGLTQDELLAIVDSLVPVSPQTVGQVNQQFLDANPLDPDVLDVLSRTADALNTPQSGVLRLKIETTVRIDRSLRDLPDPYHLPLALRMPETLIEEQTLEYVNGSMRRYRVRRALPDGRIYETLDNDGEYFGWYTSYSGVQYRGLAADWANFLQPVPLVNDMLGRLFIDPAPITLIQRNNALALSQTVNTNTAILNEPTDRPRSPHTPSLADLGPGVVVQRLWLDPQTYRPQRLEMLHRDDEGHETFLRSRHVLDYRLLETDESLATLAEPPEGAIRFDISQQGYPQLRENRVVIPQRSLVWSSANDLTLVNEQLPAADQTLPSMLGQSQHEWASININEAGYTRIYKIGDRDEYVVTVQAAADLLRYILRYQVEESYASSNTLPWEHNEPPWELSQSLEVTIAGEPRTAWLLQDQQIGVLVVEIDDMLLHISGPLDYVRGPLLELLPQLEWTGSTS